MLRISSRQNPIVGRFRAAARGTVRESILLDGAHLIADAVAAGVRIDVAAVASEAEDGLQQLIQLLARAGADVVSVTAPVLDALSPVRASTGIVALARRPAAGVERVFAAVPLVVIAAGVQDPGNVGAIVRVAEAAGATGVITTGGSADPFGWKALRGSMGSSLRLPIAHCGALDEALASVRARGCRVAATVPRGGRPLFEAPLKGPLAILVGGEGAGLPDDAIGSADERITIPMAPPVESLNAAVSAAIVLYEARRQRASRGSR